jgi:tyrosinase
MKAAALLVTGLVAVAVHAGVLPRDAPAAADDGLTKSQDLDDLIEKAKAQITDEINENEAALLKRGETPRCTVRNLVFRRE